MLDDAIIGNPASNSGLYALDNPEVYDFNLLLIPGITSGAVIGRALQFCEGRGDVLYIVDPPAGLRPQQVVEWHNGMLSSDLAQAINSSYGALYWGWLKIKDSFNGGTIWVPPSGHIAGVFARTAREAEQWFAPAGINRGRLLTPIDVEYSPSQGERDLLYGSGNAVNPIVKFAKEGLTVWGQRTLQRKSTALDRVNVRMLMIFVKKALQGLLRSFNFEPNDITARNQIKAVINPYLADIAARRGLTAFHVVCDETNNTPERVDRNELWVSVFLQPTKAAEFIAVNLVIMRTGASFSAQEVLAAGGVTSA
jgi:phage tail sheath protein FI